MLPRSPFSDEMMAQLRALKAQRTTLEDWIARWEKSGLSNQAEINTMRKNLEETMGKIDAIERNFGDLHT